VDFDGDGTDDIVVAAISSDASGKTDSGRVYVIRGTPTLSGDKDMLPPTNDFLVAFDGKNVGDEVGISLAGGQFGDGTATPCNNCKDLVIGTSSANGPSPNDVRTGAGEVYIARGRTGLSAATVISLQDVASPPFNLITTIYGAAAEMQFGTG